MNVDVMNLEKAKALLEKVQASCTFVNGEDFFYSTKRGVAPLLELLDDKKSLEGYSAADKVVGKAAAYLYILLKVKCVYAGVISTHALSVFERFGVPVEYGKLSEAIRNRDNTGYCPMETAVLDIDVPAEAVTAIRAKLEELRRG